MRINCDLKEAGLEETVWKLARENGLGAERILYSGTVSPGGVRSAYHWREVEIFWNVEECIPDVYRRLGGQELNRERIQELITTCKLYEISVINIDVRFLSRELLDAMKKNEIGISVWTVNSADQIRELLNAEVIILPPVIWPLRWFCGMKRNVYDFIEKKLSVDAAGFQDR